MLVFVGHLERCLEHSKFFIGQESVLPYQQQLQFLPSSDTRAESEMNFF